MIKVINAGFFTVVQDEGRWGYQAFGVSVSGAMDRYACRLANILAGNHHKAAVLEMTLKGDTLQFNKDAVVAVCGADMQATLNGQAIANWSSFFVPAGSELAFSYAVEGCRTYVAVNGGFDVPVVLGSRATYTRAVIGGHEGRKLINGDALTIGNEAQLTGIACLLPERYRLSYGTSITLRILTGPQDDLFTADGLATLFNSSYTITNEADRMGYRLEGPKISHINKPDIISDGLCQGAIQVPGHGMPIVMMAERQTTGGYAKIGTVIGPDLALLAQGKPSDTITFRECSEESAIAALRAEREGYAAIEAWRRAVDFSTDKVGSYHVTVNGKAYSVTVRELG